MHLVKSNTATGVINLDNVSPFAKAIALEKKLDGATGMIAELDLHKGEALLTFTHNNQGEKITASYWFSFKMIVWDIN